MTGAKAHSVQRECRKIQFSTLEFETQMRYCFMLSAQCGICVVSGVIHPILFFVLFYVLLLIFAMFLVCFYVVVFYLKLCPCLSF